MLSELVPRFPSGEGVYWKVRRLGRNASLPAAPDIYDLFNSLLRTPSSTFNTLSAVFTVATTGGGPSGNRLTVSALYISSRRAANVRAMLQNKSADCPFFCFGEFKNKKRIAALRQLQGQQEQLILRRFYTAKHFQPGRKAADQSSSVTLSCLLVLLFTSGSRCDIHVMSTCTHQF